MSAFELVGLFLHLLLNDSHNVIINFKLLISPIDTDNWLRSVRCFCILLNDSRSVMTNFYNNLTDRQLGRTTENFKIDFELKTRFQKELNHTGSMLHAH